MLSASRAALDFQQIKQDEMQLALALMILLNLSNSLSLAGNWQFAFDRDDVGVSKQWSKRALADSIGLPTTTDAARKGPETPPGERPDILTRRFPYVGIAWYRRTFDVPAAWLDKPIALYVERTKKLTVYVDDGPAIDGGINLSTSHLVKLGKLTSGTHTLTLCVDNRPAVWPDRVPSSHMLEDSTQTNWNGVLGRIELRTEDTFGIEGVRASAVGGDPRRLGIHVYLDHPVADTVVRATLTQNGKIVGKGEGKGDGVEIKANPTAELWDEFHPNLCLLTVTITSPGFQSEWKGSVGLRDFRAVAGHFVVNGRRTFLRGKHDGCVFPLTGYPPMEDAGWARYFGVVKAYGLNHVRFHSWCPPEVAFLAADKMGVYLQPELPFWGDPSKPGVEPFLDEEGKCILHEYGNHPSFVALSIGNEYWGASEPRPRIVASLHAADPTRMYDQGSNSEWWNPQEYKGDDYRVAAFAKTGEDGKLRGSYAEDKDRGVGYIQTHVSGTMHTYSKGLAGKTLPFVSHEVGQYQVFPNFAEAAKYTGVVRADNFEVFKRRLAKAGILDQAEDFRKASGRLAVECYREEVEAALRTPEMDGFQLLDLQDYPGQGTALVGILDAFMDTKGLITEPEWRSTCSSVVPLALFPKYTWTTDETFTAEIRVANYGPKAVNGPVRWMFRDTNGVLTDLHDRPVTVIPTGGVTTTGTISIPLKIFVLPGSAPRRLEFTLTVGGAESSWPLWVYPPASAAAATPAPAIVRTLDAAALTRLASGGTILYIPAAADLPNSLPGYFTPNFWCYSMFKGGNPPGTMGLLIQDKHPALAAFPTRDYSEWQWQDLAHHSRAVILDSLPGYKAIVQPIDNIDRNHRLGSVFELKVGSGKLLVCAIDLLSDGLKGSPEASQLLKSLTAYVASPAFRPATAVSPADLQHILGDHQGTAPSSSK